uniref:Uncharacterized protein n=2 Tax=Lactuca sativa TaxID=4236 RepID=A0A9R1WNX9_LACSA|nr:hypothetical protein LSAT_V11C900468560 [Lactuca sativa]
MAKLTDMSYEIALRAIAFCFTLLAAVLAIADQESSATANWLLMLVNGIVSSYLGASMIHLVIHDDKKVDTKFVILVIDIIMGALLFCFAHLAVYAAGGIVSYSMVITFLGAYVFLWLPLASVISIAKTSI